MSDLDTLGKWIFPCLTRHSFNYGSWKEFHNYKPYSLDQWKNSILFWWSCSKEQYILIYIPRRAVETEPKGAYGMIDDGLFTVTIARTPADSEAEIREWLHSMRPDMWKLEGEN